MPMKLKAQLMDDVTVKRALTRLSYEIIEKSRDLENVVLIGIGKKNLDFNFTTIQKKELNVFGSRNALKADFLELIDLVKAGGVDLEKIVTNVYRFADAPEAFAEFDRRAGEMLKVVLDFT